MAIPRSFIDTPNERNLFGLLIDLRDPVAFTGLPTSGVGDRILIANTSRVGLRLFNAGAQNIFLNTEPQDIFTKGWVLLPEKEMVFAPPWAPIRELFGAAAGTPHDLRVWELWAS